MPPSVVVFGEGPLFLLPELAVHNLTSTLAFTALRHRREDRKPPVLHPGEWHRCQPGVGAAPGVRAGHHRRHALHQGAVHRAQQILRLTDWAITILNYKQSSIDVNKHIRALTTINAHTYTVTLWASISRRDRQISRLMKGLCWTDKSLDWWSHHKSLII